MISRRAFLSLIPKVAAVVAGVGAFVKALPEYSYIRPSMNSRHWTFGPYAKTINPVSYIVGDNTTDENFWQASEEIAAKLFNDPFSAESADNSEICTLPPSPDDVDSA